MVGSAGPQTGIDLGRQRIATAQKIGEGVSDDAGPAAQGVGVQRRGHGGRVEAEQALGQLGVGHGVESRRRQKFRRGRQDGAAARSQVGQTMQLGDARPTRARVGVQQGSER